MDNIKKTSELVKSILENDKRCRNSDSLLYLTVLHYYGKKKGIDINSVPIPFFLLELHGAVVPGFETVRRARQKIQAAYPHLSASERVEGFRCENEREFRAFAVGDV